MIYFHGSTSGKLSGYYPAIAQHSETRSAAGRCSISPGSEGIHRLRKSTRRSSDMPHGCRALRPKLTVRLKVIPEIDLDKHLPYKITASGPLFDSPRSTPIDLETYSHSMINEPPKSLIGSESVATSPAFTVSFTVKVRGSSTGAGLRAIRRKAIFQDQSKSIDSCGACRHRG